jgi:hypothetical protein
MGPIAGELASMQVPPWCQAEVRYLKLRTRKAMGRTGEIIDDIKPDVTTKCAEGLSMTLAMAWCRRYLSPDNRASCQDRRS